MIVFAPKDLNLSQNPHSIGVDGNVEIPDSGNPLVQNFKNVLVRGFQGLGLGAGAATLGSMSTCCQSGGMGALDIGTIAVVGLLGMIALPHLFKK